MIQVGDTVTRMLAGTIPMPLTVTAIDDEFIVCGVPGGPVGWKFDKTHGYEVDEEIGWGVQEDGSIYTGSFLVMPTETPQEAPESPEPPETT